MELRLEQTMRCQDKVAVAEKIHICLPLVFNFFMFTNMREYC